MPSKKQSPHPDHQIIQWEPVIFSPNSGNELSQDEKSNLILWNEAYTKRYLVKISEIEKDLQQIIQPIENALKHYGTVQVRSRTTRNILLKYTCKWQKAPWQWDLQEWLALIGKSCQDYPLGKNRNSDDNRIHLIASAYLLGDVDITEHITGFHQTKFAKRIFGNDNIERSLSIIIDKSLHIGSGISLINKELPLITCEALLLNRNPNLEILSFEIIERLHRKFNRGSCLQQACIPLSHALHSLGIIPQPIKHNRKIPKIKSGGVDDYAPEEWVTWADRWYNASNSPKDVRDHRRGTIIKAGRWLARNHPDITSPDQWTRDTCIEYVAAVVRMKVGDYSHPNQKVSNLGKPLKPNSIYGSLTSIRTFFLDCQDWKWIPTIFSPYRYLSAPRSVESLRGPNPRVIADDIWAKLLSAGLTLNESDLPSTTSSLKRLKPFYPIEMVKAIVIVWLFTGLRSTEIQKLRVGCVRWQVPGGPNASEEPNQSNICLLDVPINKTSTAFVKPVDRIVGEAIVAWQKVRPTIPAKWDTKTGEAVDFLFVWRGYLVARDYINGTVIPMLCRKAGVPESDARGNITSHRARSTIATQLCNAREPMTLFELQEWLGHKSPESTRFYANIAPTKISQAYSDTNYFQRNLRLIDILVDQDAIKSGAAAAGEAWRYYDLGHGYCTYDFFDQCPHRMACAKCSFYEPKESSFAQILEGKSNLLRLQQSIPLTDSEQASVSDGIGAFNLLAERLQDVPTPQGPTPRDLMPLIVKRKK